MRGGGGVKAPQHVYKMASVVRSLTQELSRRVFIPFALSLIKYTFEDFTNEEKMCSRILEWKEMGFKGFSDNVPKIHLMDDEEKI